MTHDRMIRYFEMQQDRRPRDRFFIPLAELYRAEGRLEAASALLEEGLERCADSLSARVVLARVRRDQGRPAEARDLARAVLDRDAGHREAPQLLALPDREPAAPAGIAAATATFVDVPVGGGPTEVFPVAAIQEDMIPADAATDDEPAAGADQPWAPPAETAPAVAASPPVADIGPAPRFLTQTLAEIYLAQGHRQKALAILRRLLAEHPERADVAREIASLEAVDATADATPCAPGAAGGVPAGAAAPEPAAPVAGSPPADHNRARFEAWIDRQQGGPA